MKRNGKLLALGVVGTISAIAACGGGGGGSDTPSTRSVRFHGEILEGVIAKHSAGETYVGYQVCVDTACGETNSEGEYDFNASIPRGEISLDVALSGDEFSEQVPVRIPASATDVDIDFVRDSSKKKVEAAQVKINGEKDSSQGNEDFNDGD